MQDADKDSEFSQIVEQNLEESPPGRADESMRSISQASVKQFRLTPSQCAALPVSQGDLLTQAFSQQTQPDFSELNDALF